MNYKQIENDVLTHARYREFDEVESLKISILNRKTKLDYFLSRFLSDFEFDTSVNDPKTRFYNKHCSEYSKINHIIRVISHYAK